MAKDGILVLEYVECVAEEREIKVVEKPGLGTYVCAFVWQAVNIGLILNFGVLFPVIMERFNS